MDHQAHYRARWRLSGLFFEPILPDESALADEFIWILGAEHNNFPGAMGAFAGAKPLGERAYSRGASWVVPDECD